MESKYKRVILKISGEALAGEAGHGIDPKMTAKVADDVKKLLDMKVARSLFSDDWPIYTRTTDSCPTQVFEGANIYHSLVSDGCEIEGTVANSVIGRGVKIGKDAVVKNSIVLSYSEIGPGVHMEYQIVDKWAKVIKTKELIAKPDDPGYVKTADRL